VGVIKACRRSGFTSESLRECPVLRVVQHLQCDHPIDRGVMRAPHLAHAAATQQLDQPITPERRSTGSPYAAERFTNGQTGHCPE
jgi:hypothetical protein